MFTFLWLSSSVSWSSFAVFKLVPFWNRSEVFFFLFLEKSRYLSVPPCPILCLSSDCHPLPPGQVHLTIAKLKSDLINSSYEYYCVTFNPVMFHDFILLQVIFSKYHPFQYQKNTPPYKKWIITWRSLFPPPVPPPRLFPITVTVFQSSDIFLKEYDSAINLANKKIGKLGQIWDNIITLCDGLLWTKITEWKSWSL